MGATGTHQHVEAYDPGTMYSEDWVQDLVRKIQNYILDNKQWLVIDQTKAQCVLDYACGHGTVSLALVEAFPLAKFQGLDIHPAQVQRFNDEAEKLGVQERMFAQAGDLSGAVLTNLESEEWYSFDTAIMSMALHHIEDPIQMLVQLKKRLKSGGTLILIEWLNAPLHSHHAHHGGGERGSKNDMIEAVGGQKIHPGFDAEYVRHALTAAGYNEASIEVQIPSISFTIPEKLRQSFHSEENELMFVKAVMS